MLPVDLTRWHDIPVVHRLVRLALLFVGGRNKPDPGPERVLEIEGVKPELLRDLQIVDTISWLSKRLSPELAKSMNTAAKGALGAIQGKLPPNLSLK
jgi:hypothetical protein